ncbi:MAG: protein-L-isoaspartate(D-aspartate) O-methyltransferase [Candidatus Sedimenticola sp. (ex Thyasira tokunagai)]
MSDRDQMLLEIEREAIYTRHLTGRSSFAPAVMAAMKAVQRHCFVPSASLDQAYYNGPLSIGYSQTISQPYIVALMTDLLDTGPNDVILEVGTGSGYQAAVLSQLVRWVYTLEIIEPLSKQALRLLDQLGYDNVTCRVGDGHDGWPEEAPFDGIIVTAAAADIPPALVEQLKVGAKLVIPVGTPYGYQQLMVVERGASGVVTQRDILGVAFVPLTGGGGV